MAKAAPKKTDQASADAAPKSKSKLILILAVVLSLAAGGGAAWYFLGHNKSEEKHAAKKPAEVLPPVFVVLEPFTVNLRSEETEHYLQVALTLQVKEQPGADQIKLYMPEVRNRLLMLLSSKTAEEILTPEGKSKLAQDIVTSLKKPFAPETPEQSITNVFFTSFVVQ